MSDQPVHLDNWTIIRISGPERLFYLDGILPNDLKNVNSARSVILSPQAKIKVVFWIKKFSEYFELYVQPNMRDILIEYLLKFKLSTDITLEDKTSEVPPLFLINHDEYIPGLGFFQFYNLDIFPEKFISFDSFQTSLLERGECPTHVLIDKNPFEVGLNDLIFLSKGCFLGQEPLSRMMNMGKPRSLLYRIKKKTDGELNDIKLNDEIVGQVIHSENQYVLAEIKAKIKNLDELQMENDIEKITKLGVYPIFKRI